MSIFRFCIFGILILVFGVSLYAENKWSGIDVSVVEKYAKEHGRAPRDPIINTDQGDLLLFMFLLAGTIGGFFAGYYWKTLTIKNNKEPDSAEKQRRKKED